MTGAIAYALLAIPLAFLVFTKRFFSPMPIAIALQIAGMLVVVWARLTFGVRSFHVGSTATQGGLVTGGPYRYVRHPIYAGVLVILAGVLVGHHDVETLIAVSSVAAGLVVRIFAEERAVARTYPEYADYAKRTKRIIPWLL
ncbi:MAG TPA: isoprenylcysteine carboxylmethyltransferase family protein [Polyangiaceae bacterium]|jgi:protein-S-isoprenylcysteine O-methyltransferase Ste14